MHLKIFHIATFLVVWQFFQQKKYKKDMHKEACDVGWWLRISNSTKEITEILRSF